MFKKKIYNYKLNTLGIEYFKRVTLRSGETVFIKTIMDKPFEMILDDFNEFGKKTKIYNGNKKYFMDWVTGRIIPVMYEEDKVILGPSMVSVPKENLSVCNDAVSSSIKIFSSEETANHYDALTEDIIINTFFCKRISERLNIEIIPSHLVEEERYAYENKIGMENNTQMGLN